MEPLPFLILLAGGLLIGTAAALFLLVSGRIAGISCLVAAATRIADSDPPWWHTAAFGAGLPLWALRSWVLPRQSLCAQFIHLSI